MSIPITKRVMVAGSKKGCGCAAGCNCGKSPAKQTKQDPPEGMDDAMVERYERNFPLGKNYYKRQPVEISVKPHGVKKFDLAAQSAAEEKKSGKTMRGLMETSNRIQAENREKNSPNKMWGAAKVAHGKKKSPAKMGCYGKKK
jgi:hypothetical protein